MHLTESILEILGTYLDGYGHTCQQMRKGFWGSSINTHLDAYNVCRRRVTTQP